MAPVMNRAELLKKARAKRAEQAAKVKALSYQLPNPSAAAGWNNTALLAKADWLMVEAGVPESIRIDFKQAAMKGDYATLLSTIEDWFTVEVQSAAYAPLTGTLTDYYNNVVQAAEADLIQHIEDGLEDADPDADTSEMDEKLDAIQVNDAEDQRQAEVRARAERMIREQLGLAPDEQVIVKIIRRNP